MTDLIKEALALWNMPSATFSFVAERENRIYKVVHGTESFALRIKRPGYREKGELISELDWLRAMSCAGLGVSIPAPSKNGHFLELVGGMYVDMITWLNGTPLGQSRSPLTLDDPVRIFAYLGREMAKLHLACDAWRPPCTFTRCNWNADGLVGESPLWGRFWENPTLEPDARALLQEFRMRAAEHLSVLNLDTGLIHADLVRENVITDGQTVFLIDFDDGGYGFRLFDVATALFKNRAEPRYEELKSALIKGYSNVRFLDMSHLDLFLALRAVTYVGWIVPRMNMPGSRARNDYFAKDALDLVRAYLEHSRPALEG
ncbi:MAG: phosphotransferase [Pseudoprimorskyibacter sp.]|nr:phosphotransferase [Pseudoprimorskyibacter sp.]